MEQQSHNWVILIDPFTKEILRTKIDVSNLDSIKKMLGCDYIESVTLYNYPMTHVLCDENGRVNSTEKARYVKVGQHVYVNKIMLIGSEQSEFSDCLLKLKSMIDIVEFMPNDYKENGFGNEYIYLTGKDVT